MDDDYLQIEKATVPVIDFLDWQRQGSLELRPFYQRRSVWNPRIKSLLIDSILRGFPLPLVFLHRSVNLETTRPMRHVVDGQQRLRTILSFIDIDSISDADENDRVTVLRSHNSTYSNTPFERLPSDIQQQFLHTTLSVNILPPSVGDAKILEIFQRMNSTGLKLTSQEIRNASFHGEFKDSSYALAYAQHQRWIDWKIFNPQAIAQMKEVELAADLMGFLVRGPGPRSKSAIDKLYEQYEEAFDSRYQIEESFSSTFDLLETVYGSPNSYIRRFRTTAWFYAVFAVASGQSAFGQVDGEELRFALERSDYIIRNEEFDDEVARVLRGATADKKSRETRIQFICSHLVA